MGGAHRMWEEHNSHNVPEHSEEWTSVWCETMASHFADAMPAARVLDGDKRTNEGVDGCRDDGWEEECDEVGTKNEQKFLPCHRGFKLAYMDQV